MKLIKLLKPLSLVAYCLIMLKGEMIILPFILLLCFSLFDFFSWNQITAMLAFTGLYLLIFSKRYKASKWRLLIEIGIFMFLLTPLILRVTSVNISLFNYALFIVPTFSFITFYILSIIFCGMPLPLSFILR